MTKNLSILGSTGSIGTQALEVAENLGINITALSADKNVEAMENQIRKFRPKTASLRNEKAAKDLKTRVADTSTKVICGEEGTIQCAVCEECDTVLNSLVGISGLLPTLAAIKSKKTIALANKETLVAAGDIVMKAAEDNGVNIYPVDSEHSAVFQCLQSQRENQVAKIILTASGGPFFQMKYDDLKKVRKSDALAHPNWSMGQKITIDCATMMNKGFEIIEAMHLFKVSADDIDVLIHRESVVHSLVEFIDGAVIAQLGVTSMKLPIQYALTYPDRYPTGEKRLHLSDYGKLTFYEPDYSTFICLDTCLKAAKEGGVYPAAVNGANEVCVRLFLEDKISFTDIGEAVREVFENTKRVENPTLEDVLSADKQSKETVKKYFGI